MLCFACPITLLFLFIYFLLLFFFVSTIKGWCSFNNCGSYISFTARFFSSLSDTLASDCEDKWVVIVNRASLLLIQAVLGLQKLQELSWRLMELHGFKIVSSGIIWVSLKEVEYRLKDRNTVNNCSSFMIVIFFPLFILTGFSHELSLPGPVGLCDPVSTVTAHGIERVRRVGLRHGGVQDVLPAEGHQTPRLLLQLHSSECLCCLWVMS